EGHARGVSSRAALAAALLSERDPLLRGIAHRSTTPSDLLDRVEALEEWERSGQREGAINRGAAQFVLRARDQLLNTPLSPVLGGEGWGVRGLNQPEYGPLTPTPLPPEQGRREP